MSTLFNCLREARLEKYYAVFRANGITQPEMLASLTMPEVSALGITSGEDRRRLVELVNIVKSVHRGSDGDGFSNSNVYKKPASPNVTAYATSLMDRNPRHHNHIPPEGAVDGNSHTSGMRLEPTRNVSVRERGPNFSAASYMDMLEIMSDQSSQSELSEHHSQSSDGDEQVAPPSRAPLALSSPIKLPRKVTAIERVRHSRPTGYNYGVPSSKDSGKLKVRGSGRPVHGEDKIRVCVRKRPLNRREIRSADQDIVIAETTSSVAVLEPKVAVDLTAYTMQHEFLFDEVFDDNCTNEDVYVRAARPLIAPVFQGNNATFFAYGQTGAGKTHTMIGNANTPGLYQLAAKDVYSIIALGQYGSDLHVWVSFFEIYCGQLFDLFNRRNRLIAREDGAHIVRIAGLTETEVPDVPTLVKVLEYGNSVRSKGISGVNPDSSRSHAILQLEIRDGEDCKLRK